MRNYTTTKGTVWTYPLTAKQWRGIRRAARKRFDGSQELFAVIDMRNGKQIFPAREPQTGTGLQPIIAARAGI